MADRLLKKTIWMVWHRRQRQAGPASGSGKALLGRWLACCRYPPQAISLCHTFVLCRTLTLCRTFVLWPTFIVCHILLDSLLKCPVV